MNLRSIKPPKLGSALSSIPNTAATDLCPVLMPTHNKRCEITGTRSKDATHTKKSSRWKINLTVGSLNFLLRSEKRVGIDCCSVWRDLHLEKTSEHAGQKEILVTL